MTNFKKLNITEYCFEYKHIDLSNLSIKVEPYDTTITYKDKTTETKTYYNFEINAFDNNNGEYNYEFSLTMTLEELNNIETNKVINIEDHYQHDIYNFKLPENDMYEDIGGFFQDNIYDYNNQFLIKKTEKNTFVFKLQFPEYPMLLWFIYKF